MIHNDARIIVPSSTGKGVWVVSRKAWTETLVCDCPSYGRKRRDACKHTDLVVAADRLVDRCRHLHAGPTDGICRSCLVAFMAVAKRKIEKREAGMVPKKKRKVRKE